MQVLSFILEYVLQLVCTVGAIIAVGLILAAVNRRFYINLGPSRRGVLIATGLIGTPVHELGHAFFCLLFGHRVLGIKLFTLDPNSNTLGCVRHSYNKKNLWCRIGNFFIGLGPVIFGTGVLLLFSLLLCPSLPAGLLDAANLFVSGGGFFESLLTAFLAVFGLNSIINPLWWLFMLLASTVALHMTISASDLKAGLSGFCFLAGTLLIIDIILAAAFPPVFSAFSAGCKIAGVYVIAFLLISLLIALLLLLVSYAVKAARRALLRRRYKKEREKRLEAAKED